MTGLSERLQQLRSIRSLSQRELAVRASVPYAAVVRLEAGSGAVQAETEQLERLAATLGTTAAYLSTGAEPTPGELQQLFVRYLEGLGEAKVASLAFEPIQHRVDLVIRFLGDAFPNHFGPLRVAARLGYTQAALDDVLAGTALPSTHLLKALSGVAGIEIAFLVRGDLPVGPRAAPSIGAYYEVIQEAIAAGISAERLRVAVQKLARGEPDP